MLKSVFLSRLFKSILSPVIAEIQKSEHAQFSKNILFLF